MFKNLKILYVLFDHRYIKGEFMKLTLYNSIISFLFIMLVFSSCKNLSSDTKQLGTDKLTGKVTIEGILVTDATIKVDDVANWQTTTDANGNFKISTLSDGAHTLYVEKNLSSGEVIYYETNINLTQSETDLGTIDFPKPVHISNAAETIDKIPLNWEKSNSSSFKGYNIYRQEGLGVDNNNGDLIYSTIAKNDTSYVDYKFINGTQYSYRVYIISDDGKLSGSNIITLNSLTDINYISNGRFEISSDGVHPDFWQTYVDGTPSYDLFSIDGSDYIDGKSSLKINFIDSLIAQGNKSYKYSEISQKINNSNFVVGQTYELSFWIKSNPGAVRIKLSGVTAVDTTKLTDYYGPTQHGWVQEKQDFVMPSNIIQILLKINTQIDYCVGGIGKIWIDGIKLSPLQ